MKPQPKQNALTTQNTQQVAPGNKHQTKNRQHTHQHQGFPNKGNQNIDSQGVEKLPKRQPLQNKELVQKNRGFGGYGAKTTIRLK